jgi:hypothetical protein
VIDRYQRLYNGLWLLLPRASLAALRALPGVRRVHRVGFVKLENATSVPFIGAPKVWKELGVRGEGVQIAIIDTGIDYTHRSFGGPGAIGAYQGNDGRRIEPGTFPTAKVIHGYDFAGDSYRPIPDDPDSHIPIPDPDPLDRHGHGTHVAATAAGLEVPGKVGAGVAPGAQLVAYKVFGAEGWTPDALVLAALERAVDPNRDGDFADRAAVINLSLADDYGLHDDPLSTAANRAVSLGSIVVAAAGNGGNRPYIVGTPGAASAVIGVGASLDSSQGARADQLAPLSSRGPRRSDAALKPDLVAPGFRIPSARAGSGDGATPMNGTSMATPHVAGAAALLRRLHPTWSATEIKALLMNTATSVLQDGTGLPAAASLQGAGRIRVDVAARTHAVALGEEESASLSFAYAPLVTARTLTRTLTVRNKGTSAREYRLTAVFSQPENLDAGARLAIEPARLAVAPGVEATASLSIAIDPIRLRDGVRPVEYDGVVTLTEVTGTGEALRLPFHLIPQAVARTQATPVASSRVSLTATGARASVVEVFTLAATDADEGSGDADIRAVGVRSRTLTGQPPATPSERVLEFAIATHRPWTSASGDVLRFGIEIDVDRDDFPDYRIETSAAVVTLVNLATNRSQVSATPAVIDVNQSVIRIAVQAAEVGLGSGGAFDFLATSDSLYGEEDYTARSRFDTERPAFLPSVTRLEFRDSASLSLAIDSDARALTPSRGLLLIYPQDAPGPDQIQILPVP